MAFGRANDYFKMLHELSDYSCQAAIALDGQLKDFNPQELQAQLGKMHAIEHAADEKMHELMEKLAAEFITPIEREDIVTITGKIDDITDAIEDVLIRLYMFDLQTIVPDAQEFCSIIVNCTKALRNVFQEFSNFKKPKAIFDSIIEVNTLEEDGDRLYTQAVRKLFVEKRDPIETYAWSEVFAVLEKCCDLCEEAANDVKGIIMKNS